MTLEEEKRRRQEQRALPNDTGKQRTMLCAQEDKLSRAVRATQPVTGRTQELRWVAEAKPAPRNQVMGNGVHHKHCEEARVGASINFDQSDGTRSEEYSPPSRPRTTQHAQDCEETERTGRETTPLETSSSLTDARMLAPQWCVTRCGVPEEPPSRI